jgi:hypothetical protein
MYGQDNRLIYQDPTYDNPEKRSEILNKNTLMNVSVDFVKMDVDKIFIYDQLVLEFGENKITVNKKRIGRERWEIFSFYGHNADDNSDIQIVAIRNGTKGRYVGGTITTSKREKYAIVPIDSNNYAVVKKDYSKMRENCDNLHDYSSRIDGADGAESDDRPGAAPLPYGCRVRVLVLYTPAAQSSVDDVQYIISKAIDETNESFTNSSVNYNVELAYSGLTDYAVDGSLIDTKKMILTK